VIRQFLDVPVTVTRAPGEASPAVTVEVGAGGAAPATPAPG